MLDFLRDLIGKDQPSAADVHVSSTGSRRRIVSPNAKLPVTGEDLQAQLEDQQDGIKQPQVSKAADGARSLKPIDDKTSHTPFPYDPNALGNIRADQAPRFFGALTDQDKLPTRRVKLGDLVAMQDRVDPGKVDQMRGKAGKPPLVTRMNGRDYIADGHHRASAAWLDGKDEMDAKYKDLETHDRALKRGARHSAGDRDAIQKIHDASCALGADCAEQAEAIDPDDDPFAALPPTGGYAKGDDWTIPFTIKKADADQQLIFGWASVVEKDGQLIIDKQGDAILPEDLEKAAYDFALYARDHGTMHAAIGTGRMVESMVFTKEKQAALGIDLGIVGWWVGFKVDDPTVWAAHKDGTLPEFSIGGRGRRVEI